MSIGDGKPIERMDATLPLQRNHDGGVQPGAAVRRAQPRRGGLVHGAGRLVEPIDQRRVMYVNSHPGMPAHRAEEERLRTLSLETEARAAEAGLDYAALLRELDATCADGVTDAPAPPGP